MMIKTGKYYADKPEYIQKFISKKEHLLLKTMSGSQPISGESQPQYSPPAKPERPLGVTILAILGFLGGILAIVGGVLIAVIGTVFIPGIMKTPYSLPGIIFGALGIVVIVVGLIDLVISWGLWAGRGWAWWLTLIFAGLDLFSALAFIAAGNIFGIISLIIDGLIFYYFFKPHVKQYFGVTVSFST